MIHVFVVVGTGSADASSSPWGASWGGRRPSAFKISQPFFCLPFFLRARTGFRPRPVNYHQRNNAEESKPRVRQKRRKEKKEEEKIGFAKERPAQTAEFRTADTIPVEGLARLRKVLGGNLFGAVLSTPDLSLRYWVGWYIIFLFKRRSIAGRNGDRTDTEVARQVPGRFVADARKFLWNNPFRVAVKI
ncbi:hypothetical protein DFJ73DRAFT_768440 [Zopfochytrium polystomum]|nr:hypothetical protein DFJ73DRAFT_768440 [Zopfochytrium polystomum]